MELYSRSEDKMKRTGRLMASLGIAVCCLAISGCSAVKRLKLSNATLEGTITYQGKPVPHALVIVTGEGEAASATANAGSDGKYKVEHVPLGSVKVAVNTDAGRGKMMSEVMAAKKGEGAKPTFIGVPKKYFDPKTSPITTTISDGPNTFDIKLD